jgi:hypothetical protein
MKYIYSLFFLIICNGVIAFSQESDFNRFQINRKNDEITIEDTQSFWIQNNNSEYSSYYSMSNFKLEYDFLSKHSVLILLPFAFEFDFDSTKDKNTDFSWGDLRIEYDYMKFFRNINLSLGSFVTTLLEPVEKDAETTKLNIGSGRVCLGINTLLTGILDPVVWSVGLEYTIGLPDKDGTVQPGNIQLQASISNLVNERFGFALGIYPRIGIPEIQDGTIHTSTLSITSFIRPEIFIMFDHDYVRFSLDAYTYPFGTPFVFNIIYGHNFQITKQKVHIK